MTTALFTIPLWLDLSAVAIGAVQGAMFAGRLKEHRIDLLGVTIIGIVVGLGGGLLRDMMLNLPLALTPNNWYLVIASLSAIVGMLLQRAIARLNFVIIALDAITIGL